MTATMETSSHVPPMVRSKTAAGLLIGAVSGQFILQECVECGTVQYPPRDACHDCLGDSMAWGEVDPTGTLIAETFIRSSNEPYFKERLPWRTGIVSSPVGISVVCHLLPSCSVGEPVTMSLRLDEAGRAVVVASADDSLDSVTHNGARPVASDFVSDLQGRTVILNELESDLARALSQAALKRGARAVVSEADKAEASTGLFIRVE